MIIGTIAALMILFGGGGHGLSFDLFKDVLNDQIQDKAHRKELVAEIDAADKVLDQFGKDMDEMGRRMMKLNSRYDATRGEFDALFGLADAGRLDAIRQLLDARYALIGKMTKTEWDAMYAGVDKKVEQETEKAENKVESK